MDSEKLTNSFDTNKIMLNNYLLANNCYQFFSIFLELLLC